MTDCHKISDRRTLSRTATNLTLARVVGAALLPLPAIMLVDAYALCSAYALLSAILPAALSFCLVLNYAVLLALLLALTYGVIPLLAARQLRLQHGVSPR